MNLLEKIHNLWDHVIWADVILFDALKTCTDAIPEAHREFVHIIGTEEIWLARIEQRTPRAAVWPELSFTEVQKLIKQTHTAYRSYLAGLMESDLTASVTYTNSSGQQFTNTVGDILLHVALHGQYHRGKVNLLIRQSGQNPAPVDYIAFVRGQPAATRNTGNNNSNSGSPGS